MSEPGGVSVACYNNTRLLTFTNRVDLGLSQIIESPVRLIYVNSEGPAMGSIVLFSELRDGHVLVIVLYNLVKPTARSVCLMPPNRLLTHYGNPIALL